MILKFNKFESIRSKYIELGFDNYYKLHGDEYINPHKEIVKKSIIKLIDYNIDLSNILDLSCGSGEVTLPLIKMGYNNITGSDPYTCNNYQKNTNKKCINISFDDIVSGKLNTKYSTIISSFALHLCEESKIHILLYQLSLICKNLVIISPNKKPHIPNNIGFYLFESFEIDRIKTRIFKSSNYNLH